MGAGYSNIQSDTGSTFEFNNVKSKRASYDKIQLNEDDVMKRYYNTMNEKVIMKTDMTCVLDRPVNNGLLSAIYYAYSNHTPITFRPDDIWLAIISAFGIYVNNNAEELRNVFVDHEDKKDITVYTMEGFSNYITPSSWAPLFEKMRLKMRDEVKLNVCDWIVPTFTTTTQLDRDLCNITLMTTFKKYFDYSFVFECGLSKVTLSGTLDDWIKLKEKVKFMLSFNTDDLNQWTELLCRVLDQFINAYQHNVDEQFWQSICTQEYQGSGHQTLYKGWMLVFCPFNTEGKYYLNSIETINKTNCYAVIEENKISECINIVPIKINDAGTIYDMTLYGGIIGATYTNNTIQPKLGWCMTMIEPITIYTITKICKKSKYYILAKRSPKIQFDDYKRLDQLLIVAFNQIIKHKQLTFEQLENICNEMIKSWYINTKITDEKIIEDITNYITELNEPEEFINGYTEYKKINDAIKKLM